MRNAKRIEEGDTVLYNGEKCLVIWASVKYFDLGNTITFEYYQGVHISKIN